MRVLSIILLIYIHFIDCSETGDLIILLNKKLKYNHEKLKNLALEIIYIKGKIEMYAKFFKKFHISFKRKDYRKKALFLRFFKENKIQLFSRVFHLIQNEFLENDEIYELINKISETSKMIYERENKKHTLKKELNSLKTEMKNFKISIKDMKSRKIKRYVHLVYKEKKIDAKISRSELYAILVNDLYNFYLFLPLMKYKNTI